ncbi:MAG: hypothetical protein UD936_03065, partial [Acutalibacteraceae bacterium]|nr:hypothetical protein [Acutalibacteraceae bacterium]
MAYIKETISSNGDRTDFARALRDSFLNNSVAPFELVSEDYTTNANIPVVEVARNNLKIKFSVNFTGSQTQVAVYTKSDKYINQNTVSHASGDTNSA